MAEPPVPMGHHQEQSRTSLGFKYTEKRGETAAGTEPNTHPTSLCPPGPEQPISPNHFPLSYTPAKALGFDILGLGLFPLSRVN